MNLWTKCRLYGSCCNNCYVGFDQNSSLQKNDPKVQNDQRDGNLNNFIFHIILLIY